MVVSDQDPYSGDGSPASSVDSGHTGAGHKPAGDETPGPAEARDRARQTAEEVEKAARQQAESQFERQSGRAARETDKAGQVFRRMASEFEQQDQPLFAGYADGLARYSDTLTRSLQEKDLNTLIHQVQDMGRRQPGLFMGGAIAGGFLLARFMQASQSAVPQANERVDSRVTETADQPAQGAHSETTPRPGQCVE